MNGQQTQAFLDKMEKKREQQRIRSAKFYTNHKNKVLEKHKQKRIKDRETLNEIEQEIARSRQYKAKKTEQPPTAQLQKDETLPKNTFDYTQKDIVNALKLAKDISPGTIKTYVTGINRVYRLTGCDKFVECLHHTPKIIDAIENGLQENGKPYKKTSKLATYQVILYIIDHLLGDDAKNNDLVQKAHADLLKKYNKYKFVTKQEAIDQKTDKDFAVPTFDEYLKRCLETFGRDSKQYLIAFLYSLFTVRDNLHHLIFVTSMDETDNERNFLVNNDFCN